MKPFLFTMCFLLLSVAGKAQEVNIPNLLVKINESVKGIQSGEYKLHNNSIKLNIGEDTTVSTENISDYAFKSNPADKLVGYKISVLNSYIQKLYNGTLLYDKFEKELTITDFNKYPAEINNQDMFFPPFFNVVNELLQMKVNSDKITFISYESFNNEKCYKLQLLLNAPLYLYISTKTYLPIKFTSVLTDVNRDAKRIRTFNNWITDIKLNTAPADSRFEKTALPAYNKEKQFTGTRNEEVKLLPIGSVAPGWELPALSGGNVKLSDFTGKIVVMDFWYKACVPCQEQMIELEKLHQKYDDKKVVFVGVNTIDDPIKNKLQLFVDKRKLSMLTVYNGKTIEPLYNSYSSPVLYIIGKNGTILYTLDGYSPDVKSEVSKVLDANL